jgi:Leucine-rich repeat (LRR) protein
LEVLEDSVFADLDGLESLNLADNFIQDILEDAFQGLGNLKGLYLYKNQLDFLRSGVFHYLVNLEELFLDENYLEVLPEGLFEKNSKLKKLIVNGNNILAMSPKLLSPIKSLVNLDLAKNLCINENFKIHSGNQQTIKSKLVHCHLNYTSQEIQTLRDLMNSTLADLNHLKDRIKISEFEVEESKNLAKGIYRKLKECLAENSGNRLPEALSLQQESELDRATIEINEKINDFKHQLWLFEKNQEKDFIVIICLIIIELLIILIVIIASRPKGFIKDLLFCFFNVQENQ